MKPTTIRLPQNTLDELDQEYEEYGYRDRTEYIRDIIDNRHVVREHSENTVQNTRSTTEEYAELEERVAQLEERVDDLEYEPAPEPDPPREMEPTTPSSTPEPQGNGVEDPILNALDGWEHGRGDVEIQERRETAEMTFEWLRNQNEPKSKREFIDALHPDVETGQTEKTWWRKTIKTALDHAAERGYIEKSKGGRAYEWVGD